uniref:Uncharacterized protein n=1 Tax=Lotharella globosa TaxID=91324 RepID=A0A7S3Z5J5_9EUKA
MRAKGSWGEGGRIAPREPRPELWPSRPGSRLPGRHDFKYDIHLDTHPYKFDAKLTLFNHGNKKTEHVKVKFYASLDKNFGPHDQAHGYLGEVSAGYIQPHDSYEFKHGAVADWGHGKRYVIAVWESDCTHGQAWKVIGKVKVKNPCKCELVAYGEKGLAKVHDEHNFQYSLSLKAHDPFTAKVTLSNHGCKKAEHVKVKFYASLDKNFGPHDNVKVKFYASLDQHLAHGFLGEDYGFVHPHSSTEFKKVLSANWGHGVRYIIAAWTSECKHGETWVVLGKAKPSNWVQSP